MKKEKILIILTVLTAFFFGLIFFSCSRKKEDHKSHAAEKEILYWTCGMHPSIKVEPEEYKKGNTQCPICHMDLVPVYSETGKKKEDKSAPVVVLTDREKNLAGIATEEVEYRHLTKEIDTSGKIAYDPELTVAEEEYITALNTYEKLLKSHIQESIDRAKKLVEQSEYRLRLLGVSKQMIEELEQTRKVHTNLILPEETVWVYADIYEFEIGQVKEGQEVKVEAIAYPGEIFRGKIRAIDPVLNPKTRSVRIRAKITNPDLKLKPDMYVKVTILNHIGNVLSIPKTAVLDTGLRKVVYVDIGQGKYVMREVNIGAEASTVIKGEKQKAYPVKRGLKKGEKVVTKANFLIDSQSQLTGPASSAYGGALDKEKDTGAMPPGHQH
ncbi:MAG: efflux RND transporter periplasmic adaptor subunit [Elusimicrobia bacterium]|nr:efflux RND transporter periplasmic adaptor subunit [Elusimicrobiota bacterium]